MIYVFVDVFDSFTPVTILKTLKSKPFVLFGTHTLLDGSLRALHLFKLTANG